MKKPDYIGQFICINNSGLEQYLTLYKEYEGYAGLTEDALKVITDNVTITVSKEHPEYLWHLSSVDLSRFATREEWREQQLNKLL